MGNAIKYERHCGWQLRKARAIILLGLPGAGKSTLAIRIRNVIGQSIILSNDTIRAELGLPVVGQQYTKMVYSEALKRAKNVLLNGGSPILDSTYYKRVFRHNIFETVGSLNKPATVIELGTPIDVCLKRIRKRASYGESKVGGVDDEHKFLALVAKTEEFSVNELPRYADYLKLNASSTELHVEATFRIHRTTKNLIVEITK